MLKLGASRCGLAGSLLALGLAMVWGCGSKEAGSVSGKVTLGGQPLSQGSIVFQDSARGISVTAPLSRDGTYVAKTHDRPGLPPGTYQVAIMPGTMADGEIPLAVDPATQAAAPASPIPDRYRNPATSGLTITVKAGKNPSFDFDLAP